MNGQTVSAMQPEASAMKPGGSAMQTTTMAANVMINTTTPAPKQ